MKGTRSRRYSRYRREVMDATNAHSPFRLGLTRQHHVPISRAFHWGIPANLIGGPENVSYWPLNDNIQQGTRISEEGEALLREWGYAHLIKQVTP